MLESLHNWQCGRFFILSSETKILCYHIYQTQSYYFTTGTPTNIVAASSIKKHLVYCSLATLGTSMYPLHIYRKRREIITLMLFILILVDCSAFCGLDTDELKELAMLPQATSFSALLVALVALVVIILLTSIRSMSKATSSFVNGTPLHWKRSQ